MFGSTVLVPVLFGVNPATILLMNGVGTLIYIFMTKGKIPAYLGSSFAFISPVFVVLNMYGGDGYSYVLGGFLAVGIVLCLVAVIIRFVGTAWIDVLFPPAAMGAIVAVIGLELVPVAADMAGWIPPEDAVENWSMDLTVALVALATLLITIICWVTLRGFLKIIPILIGIVNKDLTKDPGLDRSLAGNGVSTILSSLFGSTPNTTYGENIGVLAITRVYSTWIIGLAAVIAIVLSFVGKLAAIISSIPPAVMGGISLLLFGIIAVSGLRMLVEAKVDYNRPQNLILTCVVLVIGISGASINIGEISLTGMGLATIVAMILSLFFNALDLLNLTNEE